MSQFSRNMAANKKQNDDVMFLQSYILVILD